MYTLNVYTFCLPFLPVVVEHTAIDSAPTAAASGGARNANLPAARSMSDRGAFNFQCLASGSDDPHNSSSHELCAKGMN